MSLFQDCKVSLRIGSSDIVMATPHRELEVWGQLAAAMGSSLEEVCNMQGQERDHLIRVILTGSEETLI